MKTFQATRAFSLVNQFQVAHKVATGQVLAQNERGKIILLETPVHFKKLGTVLMSVQIGRCSVEEHLTSGALAPHEE